MKRRSASRQKTRSSQPEPTYFVDRCLGKRLPELLSQAGLTVVPYHALFPHDERDVAVPDHEWLRAACSRGYVSLSHDSAMRFDERTMAVVFEERQPVPPAVFILRGNLQGAQHAEMFLSVLEKVNQMVRKYRKLGRPFAANIHRGVARGGRMTVHVTRRLDAEEWRERLRRRR